MILWGMRAVCGMCARVYCTACRLLVRRAVDSSVASALREVTLKRYVSDQFVQQRGNLSTLEDREVAQWISENVFAPTELRRMLLNEAALAGNTPPHLRESAHGLFQTAPTAAVSSSSSSSSLSLTLPATASASGARNFTRTRLTGRRSSVPVHADVFAEGDGAETPSPEAEEEVNADADADADEGQTLTAGKAARALGPNSTSTSGSRDDWSVGVAATVAVAVAVAVGTGGAAASPLAVVAGPAAGLTSSPPAPALAEVARHSAAAGPHAHRGADDDSDNTDAHAHAHAHAHANANATTHVERCLASPELAQFLSSVNAWSFDLFRFVAFVPDCPLLALCTHLFQSLGLFDKFAIPKSNFFNFFSRIESMYWNNAYHNATHAADVLQNLYIFFRSPSFSEKISPLDVFSGLVAAAIHDVAHPGMRRKQANLTLILLPLRPPILLLLHPPPRPHPLSLSLFRSSYLLIFVLPFHF